jgi:hypothetical protein
VHGLGELAAELSFGQRPLEITEVGDAKVVEFHVWSLTAPGRLLQSSG